MKYRTLGNSGLKVSELSLGTWQTFGEKLDKKHAEEHISVAFNGGINYFDCADVYANGEAEKILGHALKKFDRSNFAVSTKCFFPCSSAVLDQGLSKKHILDSVEKSLKNLELDYIDLFICHRYDFDVPMLEIINAIDVLLQQGKIAYWGVSRWSAAQAVEAFYSAKLANILPPICNQTVYNIFNRDIENEIIPVCHKLGIGIVAYSPLAQGVLTGKYLQDTPHNSRGADVIQNQTMWNLKDANHVVIQHLKNLANELDLTLAQLALAWCLKSSRISTLLMGASHVEQIEQNLKASEVILPEDAIQQINVIMGEYHGTSIG